MFESLKITHEFETLLKAVSAKKSSTALFGLPSVGRANFIAQLASETRRPIIVATQGEAEATRLCEDIKFFGEAADVFPARDLTLRGVEGQNREYEYRRLSVLGDIVGKRTNIVCTPIEALLQYTVPKEDFCQNTITLKPSATINVQNLVEKMYSAGYQKRERVDGSGQFSVRGGIVDIFAPDMKQPARLEFWGDEIESIHSFDLLTQRREEKLSKIYLSPAREVLCGGTAETLAMLNRFAEKLSAEKKKCFLQALKSDIAALQTDIMPESLDKYLAVRYPHAATIFEYFENPIIFVDEPTAIKEAHKGCAWRQNEEIKTLLEQGVLTAELSGFYADYSDFLVMCEPSNTIVCENFARTISDFKFTEIIGANAHSLPIWAGDTTSLFEDLVPLLREGYFCAVLAGTKRAAQALQRDLDTQGLNCAVYTQSKIQKINDAKGHVAVLEGHLSGGVSYPFAKFAVFSSRRHGEQKKAVKAKKNKGLTSLEDITPGDYVVHQNHGIGQYVCINTLDLQGVVKDYIKIAYDKGDTLYVPVTQLDLISRYTAPGDAETVKLARLGGTQWQASKAKVKKATEEMAKELIELYAKRQQAVGNSFPEDSEWQRDFETRFEYDETDDQLRSIAEIKQDMQSTHPMDRLLCGDVGVGKTEVALRAAFKCVMGGKQCAILVPTTILAWQHYETICRRMSAFPVHVGLLSRFRTASQQRNTISEMHSGTVDIVVGTHRLLQKDIKFKNLGLVIIDEEQRFGVKHKEKLKESFIGVDMLSLSATPIPRTLNMAMSGIRDMSSIEQPPQERQPIETYVLEYNENVIEQALRKELARAGQVYYLHNRVESIERCAAKLAQMVPNARIATAHGKMTEEQLSLVWQQLIDNEIDILVCTTIIETGVDVRNCNTLIIEDADRMGLAQLYQIRGRVGRSGRKAYAYFTFRRDKVLTDIAAKRLSAIREFTSFGSGLRIAMRDLQIRGVGSLLGQSQHGHMQAVGYDMYVKLLNQAVAIAKGEPLPPDKSDCLIDITIDAYIPEKYITSPAGRIEAYKKIAAIETAEDAEDIMVELADRYGKVPACVKGLLDISLVRVTASQLGIYEVNQRSDMLMIYSDKFNYDTIKATLRCLNRRITVNASAKPYLAVTVRQGEKPVDVLSEVLCKLYELK